MAKSRVCFTTVDQELEDPQPQGADIAFVKDKRYIVKDANIYPHMAIAFMQMQFDLDDDEIGAMAGTGFLCKNHIFITCAHNVVKMGRVTKNFATTVSLTFGANGEEDIMTTSGIELEGNAFSIPKGHRKGSDQYDIAWVDLRKYYNKKREEGVDMDWSLEDLPKKYFHICGVPETPGLLKGDFHICGR